MPSNSMLNREVRCIGCGRFLMEYRGVKPPYMRLPCKYCKADVILRGEDIHFRQRNKGLTNPAK